VALGDFRYKMAAWLPIIGALVGLAATVVGWSLNQLGQWFGFRRDRKKAMARAIYGMLRIRDRIRILPEAVKMLSDKLQIPAAQQVILVAVMETFFLSDDDPTKDFEESMIALAQYDPVLAARMRGRDQVIPVLKKLRQMFLANPLAAGLWSAIEGQIMTHALPQFDEAILEMGSLHGRHMVKSIKAELGKKTDVPEEILTTITTAIQQQIQIDQAAQAARTNQVGATAGPPHRQRVPLWSEKPPTT